MAHCYSVYDADDNFIFRAASVKEIKETIEGFGGTVVQLSGRSNFRRFPKGVDKPKNYTDYHAKMDY